MSSCASPCSSCLFLVLLHFFVTIASAMNGDPPIQRFDGWFNNLNNPNWGAVDQPLRRIVPPAYSDETYRPSGPDRPNPRVLSNMLFGQEASQVTSPRGQNKTAIFGHFGYVVKLEILHTDRSTCPPEILETPVPRGDPDFDPEAHGQHFLPYERLEYDRETGNCPNNPRAHINSASSVIDGSFLYGMSEVRNEFLRERDTGKLACQSKYSWFPLKNDVGLPYHPLSYGHQKMDHKKLWRMGDPNVFETPPILSFSLVLFHYHNNVAGTLMTFHPNYSSDTVFHMARRWVVGVMQNLIVYEWLPRLLGKGLPPYTGYKPWVNPAASELMDAGAIDYILTLIPAAINRIDMTTCKRTRDGPYAATRLCNTYWDALNMVYSSKSGTEEILLGLALQTAGLDDTIVVEDLRSKFYGPLYHSRLDAVVRTIMKGRDYGIPDYNTVRKAVGLEPVTRWEDINPWMTRNNPKLLDKLKSVHQGNLTLIDMFVGGMMETTPTGPGPLFTTILIEQFTRIRDGDRFWFENLENGMFSQGEINAIREVTLKDIIINTTTLRPEKLQNDLFTLPTTAPACGDIIHFNTSQLRPCPNHQGYNFFKGSEIPYIIIWTCVGLLPFVCIFAAFLLAMCKKWRHKQQLKDMRLEKEKKRILRRTLSCSVSVHDAMEWRGSQPSRPVELHITTKGSIEVFTSTGSHVRTIKVEGSAQLLVKSSANKKRNFLMLVMPREYDLVVEFMSEPLRADFENVLAQLANTYSVDFSLIEIRLQELYNTATTKEKRNKMLEKFFKTIFSEAFQMDYDPSLDSGHLDMKKQSEGILEVELSKDEFAEAMAVETSSAFVEHFFSLIDSDRNGYISFREFLNAVVLFSKGSTHEKLQTMFYMYDIDGTGYMSKKQIGQMIKSLLELAHSDLGREDIDLIVNSLCSQSGVEDKDKYSFDDFCQILSPQMGKLWNASFDWKGLTKVLPSKLKSGIRNGSTSSETDSLKQRIGSSGSQMENGSMPPGRVQRNFEAVRETYTPLKAKLKMVKHFVENYRSHIFILVLFYGICLFVFAERVYFYTFEQEDAGYRKLMSYGISMTRGAAAAMSFTFSALLLTMCRNTITFFRSTALNLFIPFDSHVSFHKIVAWSALFFSGIHILGYSFNFYHLVTQPTRFMCIFKSLTFTHNPPTFQWWLFETLTGSTGVLLVLVLCILFVFATQTARRYIFNWFWLTHKLFIVLYVLTIIHGASCIVQKPMFYYYFCVPAIWFTIDKVISLSRKKTEICVIRAQNLPSDVTMIEFKRPPRFEYKSGQWVRIACLSQGKDEYHPFTLTSAPHEDTLTLHIRALGPWTWNLRHLFESSSLKAEQKLPKIYLDGPYGAGQQDWYQYDVSVLVGAGIGVTPYASILKDFVHMASINMTYKVKCQKLYFIWITGSQRHFEWLIEILREVEEIDTKSMVSIDIFITQFFQNFDLRTSLLYIFEEHFQRLNGGKSVFTGLTATTHFGRPQMNKIMGAVHRAHPQVRKVGVFSCGPAGVTKGVERACSETSKQTKAMFEHHFENF